MKHPALARVFSVVLAILALIEAAVGVRGLQKNEQERVERDSYAARFEGRIESYRTLHAELAAHPDYQKTVKALDTFTAAHEKAAGRHKTDTAIYSATKGGLKMGEDLILAGREELLEAKAQLRDPNTRDQLLESTLSQLIASQRGNFPWLDALASSAVSCADQCRRESGRIAVSAGEIRLLMQMEPQPAEAPDDTPAEPIEPPVEPQPPEPPVYPGRGEMSEEELQAAFAEITAAYEIACAEYSQAYAQYQQDYYAYYAALAEQQAAQQRAAVMQSMQQGYYTDHESWESECRNVRAQPPFPEVGEAIRNVCAALASIESTIRQQAPELWDEIGAELPDPGELAARANAAAAVYSGLVSEVAAEMSNEAFLSAADEAQGILDELTDCFLQLAATLADPAHLLVRAMDKLQLTDTVVSYVEQTLKKAEQQLQAALEEMWYQAGELKKNELKLEAQKYGLDSEAKVLAERREDADSLKDLQNRHSAARLVLTNVPEIKSRMTDEESIPAAAEAYLRSYREQTETLFRKKQLMNWLAIAGGAMGALGIPAAFELIKKRFWLLAPVLLCLGCSAAADAISLQLGIRQLYVALVTAIFALIQLLIVLPRRKRPAHLS